MSLTVPVKLGASLPRSRCSSAPPHSPAAPSTRCAGATPRTEEMGMGAMAVRGLAVSDDDFTLQLAPRSAQHPIS